MNTQRLAHNTQHTTHTHTQRERERVCVSGRTLPVREWRVAVMQNGMQVFWVTHTLPVNLTNAGLSSPR